MKKSNRKRIVIFATVLAMVLLCVGAAHADVTSAKIDGVTIVDGIVTAVEVSSEAAFSGKLYIAIYDDHGKFVQGELTEVSAGGTIPMSENLSFDPETQVLKCFLWDGVMKPLSASYTYSDEQGDGTIHLCDTYIDATGIEGVSTDGSVLTIRQAGAYYIEGTLSDGSINIAAENKSDEVQLFLTDVTVTSSTSNAVNATKGKVTLTVTSGSTSTFISSFQSETDAGNGIYSKNDLTIKGEDATSKLIVSSTHGNAIRCKADVEIGAGDLEVEAGNNGIKGDEGVKITKKAGVIAVNATGDAIKTDAIDSDTAELEYGKGNIVINGGTLALTCGGDGLQADDTVTINGGELVIVSETEGIKANTVNTSTTDDDGVTTQIEGNVIITNGSVNITAKEDGIKGAGTVDISGGTIVIVAGLDGIQSGVDYTDETETTVYSSGNLSISKGTISITAGGGATAKISDEDSHKGIKAYNELLIRGGNIKVNSYDDAIHSNYTAALTGGTLELSTADDGIHADYQLTMGTAGGADTDYSIDIKTSYEGLEASVIEYLSGTTYLYSTDDGVNAAGDYKEDGTKSSETSQGSGQQPGGRPGGFGGGPGWGTDDSAAYGMIYIKGGKLYVVAKGDGLDSNGDIHMSGGVVLVNGTTSGGNGVFDKGDNNNSFTVTGGTLIGFGTTDMQDNPSSVSNGYFSKTSAFSLTKGKAFSVSTDTGSLIIVPEITLSRAMLYVTCGDMTKGKSYSVSTNASAGDAAEVLTRSESSVTYGLWKR